MSLQSLTYNFNFLNSQWYPPSTDLVGSMATTSSGSKHPPPNRDNDGSGDKNKPDGEGEKGQMYDCNICLDTAKDAVISMCGHLFW